MSFPRVLLVLPLLLGLSACEPAAPATDATSAPTTASAAASAAPTAAPDASPAPEAFPVPDAIKAVIDAADRSEDDRKLDAGRHPGEMLAFFGIAPGMKVAELAAGGGYTAELLARTVGPTGVVYGQNSKFLLDRFAEKPWSERLTKPVMKTVVRVDRDFDDPLPAEATNLDAVFMVLFYHDTVWFKTDRGKMNAAIFKALKPGGIFAIVDHSGRAGTGTSEAETLHRIEESVLRAELEQAGFKLAAEASFLRNPDDTRDWSASPRTAGERRGTSDRFVLKFVKP
ncbi:MAG: methyltransferase domain-containing protein [Polyangiaceae bacterium]